MGAVSLYVSMTFVKETWPLPLRLGYLRLPLYPLLMLNNKEKCKLLEKEFTLETYRYASTLKGQALNKINETLANLLWAPLATDLSLPFFSLFAF